MYGNLLENGAHRVAPFRSLKVTGTDTDRLVTCDFILVIYSNDGSISYSLSVRRSTFGAHAFAIAGPTVWNSLPDSLRDPAVGPDQFRRDLKTHLFE